MTTLEKRLLAIAMVFGVLTLSVVVARGGLADIWKVPEVHAASGAYYGADDTTWAPAAANDWPQANGNWCGVANIEMIANFTYQAAANNPNNTPFQSGGQSKIAGDLNNSAIAASRWGIAPPTAGGPGFKADIAADGGTDPRSIAWGIFYESAYGGLLKVQQPGYLLPSNAIGYHNAIYHTDAAHALGGLARTLERFRLPVSVTVAHGLHSDVVTGVWSTNDPVQSYPAAVNAVATWDPQPGAYQSSMHIVWDAGTFMSPNANFWGQPYAPNYNNNGVAYDPDPSVGIYTPNGSYPHHWIGYYVDIEPDSFAAISPDYALDENGNVMLHP